MNVMASLVPGAPSKNRQRTRENDAPPGRGDNVTAKAQALGWLRRVAGAGKSPAEPQHPRAEPYREVAGGSHTLGGVRRGEHLTGGDEVLPGRRRVALGGSDLGQEEVGQAALERRIAAGQGVQRSEEMVPGFGDVVLGERDAPERALGQADVEERAVSAWLIASASRAVLAARVMSPPIR